MITTTHINSISFTDLKGRTTAHSHFIAQDLDAASIVDANNGMTAAMFPGNRILTITTYDAIGLDLGADMILKYELINGATSATKFDMLPVNTTAEATEILRKVINRAG